jgi:hypothetical protein
MKKKHQANILILPVLIIAAVAVAFYMAGDGWYRYPCQDPSNFTNPSCHPPSCLAAEYCTDMLIDLGEHQ